MGFAKWHLLSHVGEDVILMQRPGIERAGLLVTVDTAAAGPDEVEHSVAVLEVAIAGGTYTVLIALEAIDSCQVPWVP